MNNLLWLELLLIFILPIVLLFYKIIPFRYRLHVLALIFIFIIGQIIIKGWSLIKLGLNFNNFWSTLLVYSLSTSLALLIIKFLTRKIKSATLSGTDVIIATILSFGQELIFRSFLLTILKENIQSIILVIFINSFLFFIMHLIYKNDWLSLLLIFMAGLIFASLYYFWPNLIFITIMHTLLNIQVIRYQMYSKEKIWE